MCKVSDPFQIQFSGIRQPAFCQLFTGKTAVKILYFRREFSRVWGVRRPTVARVKLCSTSELKWTRTVKSKIIEIKFVFSVPATRSARPGFESRPRASLQSGLRGGRSLCEYIQIDYKKNQAQVGCKLKKIIQAQAIQLWIKSERALQRVRTAQR